MKKTNIQQWLCSLFLASMLFLAACKGGAKDEDIQKSFAQKSATDGRLGSVSATVKDGVVTLSGNCPDETCRSYAEQSAKEINGVKSVVNTITVTAPAAPVQVTPDSTLQNGVRDAVKDYPGVNATVNNGEVVLTGTIQRDRLTNLIQAINALSPAKVTNNLTIQ